MQSLKKAWFKIPDNIRKPFTLIIGMIFVILAGLTGWLPGPGGIPLFLIGITILATEFHWAERLKNVILAKITTTGKWIKQHPRLGFAIILLTIIAAVCILYFVAGR